MRKLDIQKRVQHLDEQLQRHKDTIANQADERQRLMLECERAGDHVPLSHWDGQDVTEVCWFCGHQAKAGQQQISRNLVTG